MKSLTLFAFAALSFGALVLTGCSSCDKPEETPPPPPPAVTCGPGTVAQGSQCVGTTRL